MSQPSTDAKAVVVALGRLTTQVRRLADAHTTTTDDAATTPVVSIHGTRDMSPEAREALGALVDVATRQMTEAPAERCGNPGHRAHPGFTCAEVDQTRPFWEGRWGGAHEEQAPAADEDDDPPAACWHTEPGTPCDWDVCRQPERLAAGDRGTDPATTPPLGPKARRTADEDALRATRRDSLRNLLARVNRGALTTEECALLWQHVEAEIRENNTARSVARSNLRHVKTIVPEIERLTAELEDAEQRATGFLDDLKREQAASAGLAEKIREQREFLARVRGELAEAQVAIERVRAEAQWISKHYPGLHAVNNRLADALDGTEQTTTEA